MCFSYFASPGSAHQLPSRTFPVVSLGAGTSFLPFIISRLDIVPILFNKAMNQLIDKKKKTFSILFPLSLFSLSLSPSSFLCLCFHPSSLVTVLFFFCLLQLRHRPFLLLTPAHPFVISPSITLEAGFQRKFLFRDSLTVDDRG